MERSVRTVFHNDGLNAWRMVHLAPPPALAADIQGYSDYQETTQGFTTRRELPHAEGVLIFNLGAPIGITGGDGAELNLQPGEGFFAGAHLRPALSHSSGSQAGIHVFLPLTTLRRLLGAPMDEFADRTVPLDALLGCQARALGRVLAECNDADSRAARLDQALAHRLGAAPALDRQQAHAIRLLRAHPRRDIAEIARHIGWSRKHFADRVRDAVGVGPRCFRRLLRFQGLTAAIRQHAAAPDWARLALDGGYCDQSHMIREFREFGALTPSEFWRRSLPDGGGLVEG